MMNTKLYVWDEEAKQVIIIDKEECELDEAAPNRKRMLLVDEQYETNQAGRYGSYEFSNYEYLLGSWITEDLSDFPDEFRTQLLLLDIE